MCMKSALCLTGQGEVSTLEEGRGEDTLAGLMVMNMKEVLAFSQMAGPRVITTEKISGATTEMPVISPQNAELVPIQEGMIILTEDPGMSNTQDGLWNIILLDLRTLQWRVTNFEQQINTNRAAPPPRNQGMYPAPRSLPESGADTLVQAILNLDRGDDRQDYRRKAPPFPPLRDRSPHSRSGSSVSSRSYSPDRAKNLPFPSQQGGGGPEGHTGPNEHLRGALFPHSGHESTEKIPGLSREGSPSSATSNKEENNAPEAEKEEALSALVTEESQKTTTTDNFKERRGLAIAAKAREIEKVYRQDCETFGMVVKMLVAKDPNLEKQLQVPLRENLGEIRERCLEDLKHFISELDEAIRQPEPPTCDSTAPSTTSSSHKVSKTGINHSSTF
ncbi:periphilin-1 isoform X2 [Phyllopteryx taeniolatus]|uniref:periphilin-1 isoform X2 n=1 Tax=Phyllopteryx taeniolatus TaxID=161469 RepID=UPI002AD4017C|nr:periphilin-1 isoform X2 [Phyllopteryx taeniolatus]